LYCHVSKSAFVLGFTWDEEVVTIMEIFQFHLLSCLSKNKCWLLFRQYAFRHDSEEWEELVAKVKETVKKCGTLPLAPQAFGYDLIRSSYEENQWLKLKRVLFIEDFYFVIVEDIIFI